MAMRADRSPFAANEGLLVSVSQIKTYLRCPRAHEYRYVRGALPEFLPVPLAFGTAIHSGLAAYYGGIKLTGRSPPPDEVVQAFRDAWERAATGTVPLQRLHDEDEEEISPVDKGVEMLSVFFANAETGDLPEVDSVELPFIAPLFDPDSGDLLEEKLSGVMDLVLVENGRKVIVEHKSSAKRYAPDVLRFDFQVTAYQHAARELHYGEVGLRYQIITKTKKPVVQIEDVRRDSQDEDDFLRISVGVLAAIDAGISYPVRGWMCRSCPYQMACNTKR